MELNFVATQRMNQMKPFSVVHVITTIDRGGAELQLLLLAEAQIRMGYDVKVLPLKGKNELGCKFEQLNATVDNTLLNKKFFVQGLLLRSRYRNKKSLLHCHLPRAELLVALFGPWRSHKVCTRHFGGSFLPSGPAIVSRRLSKLSERHFDKVIAISNAVKEFLVTSGEVKNVEKIETVMYGFDSVKFAEESNPEGVSPELRSLLENSDGEQMIGMVSRLDPEKRIDLAIETFYETLQKTPNKKLLIVGEGSRREELQEKIDTLGIQSKVKLLGKQDSISYFMGRLDLFLHTSLFEGFGMVFLEAMASEVPIVAFESAGAVEVLGRDGAATFFRTKQELIQILENSVTKVSIPFNDQQAKKLKEYSITETARRTDWVYNQIARS
jgi:glycosyltransferase involved in cell wall biosynthesis